MEKTKDFIGMCLLWVIVLSPFTAAALLCCLYLAIQPACADSPRPLATITNTDRFETYDAAARAALAVSAKLSKKYEYGGVVIKCGDLYAYTDPVTTKSPVEVRYDLEYDSTCTIAALYHTHPGTSHEARQFSDADRAAALRLKVPSYILAIQSKVVRVGNER